MKIIMDKSVSHWFKNNINLESIPFLRFYPKMMRKTDTGFALGNVPLEPTRIHVGLLIEDILYYIEEGDQWFFEGHDLLIQLDPHSMEPTYIIK